MLPPDYEEAGKVKICLSPIRHSLLDCINCSVSPSLKSPCSQQKVTYFSRSLSLATAIPFIYLERSRILNCAKFKKTRYLFLYFLNLKFTTFHIVLDSIKQTYVRSVSFNAWNYSLYNKVLFVF